MSTPWLTLTWDDPQAEVDPAVQQKMRDEASQPGPMDFLRAVVADRTPDDTWWPEALCQKHGDEEVTVAIGVTYRVRDLFFPQPLDEDELLARTTTTRNKDYKQPLRVELARPARIRAALSICQMCPVSTECLAWGMRLGGSEKQAVIGGLTWSQRKRTLALLRRQMRLEDRPDEATVLDLGEAA